MDHKQDKKDDQLDGDLFEEFDDEELYELVQEERRKALERARRSEEEKAPKRSFPKWAFWLIAFALVFNLFALIPKTFSIPAFDFLVTSAKLSAEEDIRTFKEAVVVVETDNSKGTGFSISANGTILTNHHVVEGEEQVTVAFPEDGLFTAEVTEQFPEIDLAVLEVNETGLPSLPLAQDPNIQDRMCAG